MDGLSSKVLLAKYLYIYKGAHTFYMSSADNEFALEDQAEGQERDAAA